MHPGLPTNEKTVTGAGGVVFFMVLRHAGVGGADRSAPQGRGARAPRLLPDCPPRRMERCSRLIRGRDGDREIGMERSGWRDVGPFDLGDRGHAGDPKQTVDEPSSPVYLRNPARNPSANRPPDGVDGQPRGQYPLRLSPKRRRGVERKGNGRIYPLTQRVNSVSLNELAGQPPEAKS